MTERPHILMILADELRADALGCFGNRICRTPNLDALAAAGTVLTQCMVTQPTCTPSRASMLTGCYPSALRSRMVGCHTPDDPRFVPRVLSRAGYRTASVGKLHLIPQSDEVARLERAHADGEPPDYYGFAEVDLVNGHGMGANGPSYTRWLTARVPDAVERMAAAEPLSPGVNNATGSLRSHTWTLPPEVHSGEYITDRAVEFLTGHAERDDRPFFLHVSFPDPHHPNTAPEPYAGMYDPERMPPPIPPVNEADGATPLQLAAYRGGGRRDPVIGTPPDEYARYTLADWQATKAIYYGMVTLLDTQIGRILSALRSTGLDRDTVVVFATDHGDYLGDHGMMGKGFGYDGAIRTPVIVSGPGVAAGRRLDGVASTVDLAPTLLDYAGVEEPEGIQGVSMRAALDGTGSLPRDAALTENDDDFVPTRARTLTTRTWKLTWYCGSADGELYDRVGDPEERRNVWHEPVSEKVKTELLVQLLEQVACAVDTANGRRQPPSPPVPKWLPRRTEVMT
ncbi:sulfatase family protein [Phytoactinopolyspora halotolerans]|uniref:Sulfatase-like hydrolase/transferase n=1 Tax=Phytoactinopolyspora halotolerans TaxID=1981512 RepID=A0A6L9S2P0_9ACTN|nr:sulfatase-like hydrolase/transferase [Phytoactinopolyspora halotolerans]NED98883.1 sulfatase-like hydrolase/transferase [Phytoactinopolyspora halotolerans]